MRRSVREASLGFCLLVAIASGLGLWFWLKGISLGRQTWTMEASFQDAAGLAPRSPVSYRGVMVGSVQALKVTDTEVVAELTITDPKLRLPLPVVAVEVRMRDRPSWSCAKSCMAAPTNCPGSKKLVGSANDLKPESLMELRRTVVWSIYKEKTK